MHSILPTADWGRCVAIGVSTYHSRVVRPSVPLSPTLCQVQFFTKIWNTALYFVWIGFKDFERCVKIVTYGW